MMKRVLFDCGGVLAYPATGNWFITPKTSEIIGESTFKSLMARSEESRIAFQKANEYLNSNHLLHTEEEEVIQHIEFYRIFLTHMGMEPANSLCEQLAEDVVSNDSKIVYYDDVLDGLREIKNNYKVAVLSDTWPSLSRTLTNAGIFDLLDDHVFSCDHGVTKRETRLFEITLSILKDKPEEIMFIDDVLSNLANAEKMGIVPVLMDRNHQYEEAEYPIVRNMEDVIKLLQGYGA